MRAFGDASFVCAVFPAVAACDLPNNPHAEGRQLSQHRTVQGLHDDGKDRKHCSGQDCNMADRRLCKLVLLFFPQTEKQKVHKRCLSQWKNVFNWEL